MKAIMKQADRVPFTMELMPCKMPSEEWSSAVKVIDESQDVEALKNAFVVARRVIIFNPDLVTSSPFLVGNLIGRIKRYIASEANWSLTQHACKTLAGKNKSLIVF